MNMEPNLACEIEKSWIDPGSFTIDHILGKGILL